MTREFKESLKDLQDAKSHIRQAAACLFNLTANREGGDKIKLLRFHLLSLQEACEDIEDVWEEGVI